MAQFDRERIPERVVHAKGAGAFGYFEVTDDSVITSICKAKVFERAGKRTPVAVRFSTVGVETILVALLLRCILSRAIGIWWATTLPFSFCVIPFFFLALFTRKRKSSNAFG
jgi:hypothetical protein